MKISIYKTQSTGLFGGYNTINIIPRLHYYYLSKKEALEYTNSSRLSITFTWLIISIFIKFK